MSELFGDVRIAKAATDAGFDLTPSVVNGWQIFGSSAFAAHLGVRPVSDDAYLVGFSDVTWGKTTADETAAPEHAVSDDKWAFNAGPLQGYRKLHKFLARAVQLAPAMTGGTLAKFHEQTKAKPDRTEVDRLVTQRIGQDLFRKDLVAYWQGRCAVSGLDVVPLLRASHIKPWAACESDEERLDVFNGLLLAPHLDALFDGGWITFDLNGVMVISQRLDHKNREVLGIQDGGKLLSITEKHQIYLVYHRGNHIPRIIL